MAILVFILYVQSDKVRELYRHPALLWLLCPLFLYWISRIWMLAHRGKLHEDPVLFAITDRISLLVGLLTAAILMVSV